MILCIIICFWIIDTERREEIFQFQNVFNGLKVNVQIVFAVTWNKIIIVLYIHYSFINFKIHLGLNDDENLANFEIFIIVIYNYFF